jgi:hypothetical protein
MIRTDGPVQTPSASALALVLSTRSSPPGMTRKEPVQTRQHGDLPVQLSPFRRGQLAGPGDRFVDAVTGCLHTFRNDPASDPTRAPETATAKRRHQAAWHQNRAFNVSRES